MTGWNLHSVRCKAFETVAGILVNARFRGSPTTFSILNFYGPYSNRESFWGKVRAGDLLSLPSLILAGDINFTLNTGEIWGNFSRLDPLTPFFTQLLSDHHLVDLAPPCTGPTWKNCRAGIDGICKKLDKFLLSTDLVPSLHRYRVWSSIVDVFDHYPICLEWNVLTIAHSYPFKFNRVWLLEEGFSKLVSDC